MEKTKLHPTRENHKPSTWHLKKVFVLILTKFFLIYPNQLLIFPFRTVHGSSRRGNLVRKTEKRLFWSQYRCNGAGQRFSKSRSAITHRVHCIFNSIYFHKIRYYLLENAISGSVHIQFRELFKSRNKISSFFTLILSY